MDKKTTLWVVLLLVVVAGVGAGVYYATKPSDTKAPAVTSETNTTDDKNKESAENETDTAAGTTITYTDDGFSPATVTIKKGQAIKVVNDSSSPMEFSSADHPTHLQDPELNMTTLQPGQSGTITPAEVGTHGYHDHLKSEHTGSITVTE